jgi:hypothetical protein
MSERTVAGFVDDFKAITAFNRSFFELPEITIFTVTGCHQESDHNQAILV